MLRNNRFLGQLVTTLWLSFCGVGGLNALYAQPSSPCRSPIAPIMLQVYLEGMDTLALESERITRAKILLEEECVLAEQGAEILEKLALGSSRLAVAKLLYARVIDRHNFYIIEGLIRSETYAKTLADFIENYTEESAKTTTDDTPADSLPQTEKLDTAADDVKTQKAEVEGYYGPIGCRYLMGDAAMDQARAALRSRNFPDQRKATAEEIIGQYCMCVSQVKQLIELIDFESDRLDLARFAFAFTHDQGNSYQLITLFNHERNAEQYVRWLDKQVHGKLGTHTRPITADADSLANNLCGDAPISNKEFRPFIELLETLSFSDGKELLLRYWLKNRCLNTKQVIEILNRFGSDNDRLRMAKALFPYTVDNHSFFLVNDVFIEDESIAELNEFILANQ